MASPFATAAEAVTAAFSGFEPTSIEPLRGAFKDLPELLDALHKGVARMAETCDNQLPVDKKVVEALQELLPTIAGLRDAAGEIGPQFESAHEAELSRIDNPRTGEEIFDLSANR